MDNNEIYGELIGCDELHSSNVINDSLEKYEAGIPAYLAPTAEITHDTATNTNKRYYDNRVMFITVTEGETNVNITVSGVPCSKASELTGKPYDKETGMFFDTGSAENTPWRTLSGRMSLGDGGYRYFQYLKGKFSIGSQTARTKEADISVNTVTLTFSAAITTHKFKVSADKISGVKAVMADTTDSAFVGADEWFSKVQTPPEVTAAAQTEQTEETEE